MRAATLAPHKISLVLPLYEEGHVADIERRADVAGGDVGVEHPVQQVGIDGQVLRPQHRVAVRLQIDFDLVADAGVHVVGPRHHQDAGALLARAPLQDLARFGAQALVVGV